jgi:proton glutamate symport protein
MKRLAPHWQILIALGLATLTALALRGLFHGADENSAGAKLVSFALTTCRFVGDLFMRALKMIIVPLIVTAVVSGITGMQGVRGLGRLGAKTVVFYLTSSFVAILIGLAAVNLFQPGLMDGKPNEGIRAAFEQQESKATEAEKKTVETADQRQGKDFLQIFRVMLPENIIHAAGDNGQLLGVIVFSILFAMAATQLPGDTGKNIRDFFSAANDAMIILTNWIMAIAPIGVYALILPVIYEIGADLFKQLGKYFFTVLFALLIHLFVILPLALKFLGKVSPLSHLRAMRPALLMAFSTASSSATIPVTLRAVEENTGVSKRVASFTIPLGATVNMNGTALYECVAVIFVAQVMGIELGVGAQFFIVVAALLTSIGVAGIPSASLVAILLILKNSGIPNAETAVVALLSVDRLLDMSRTAVNVYGDSCAAVIVARSEGEVFKLPHEEEILGTCSEEEEVNDTEMVSPEDNSWDDIASQTEQTERPSAPSER